LQDSSCDLNARKINQKINNRLVFGDNYEGRQSKDPFEARGLASKKIPNYTDIKNKNEDIFIDVDGNECTIESNAKIVQRYVKEVTLDGADDCYCVPDKSKSDFTRDEIDEYREQNIQFRDKVYGSSSPAIDPVDKINQITFQGGIKGSGQAIADVYDNLVGNRVTLNSPNNQQFIRGAGEATLRTPIPPGRCINNMHPNTNINMKGNGGYISQDNWMYPNEKAMNGGMSSDGIQGLDPMMNFDRTI